MAFYTVAEGTGDGATSRSSACSADDNAAGKHEGTFLVPLKMQASDRLDPIRFEVSTKAGDGATLALLGRYDDGLDLVQFVLAGSEGTRFKLTLADWNVPYGWKHNQHGVTRSVVPPQGSGSEAVDEVFNRGDLASVSHALMRVSHSRKTFADAPSECVGPWSFYGPSFPKKLCRCRFKVLIYGPGQKENIRSAKLEMMEPFASQRGPDDRQQQRHVQAGTAPPLQQEDDGQEAEGHDEVDKKGSEEDDEEFELSALRGASHSDKRKSGKDGASTREAIDAAAAAAAVSSSPSKGERVEFHAAFGDFLGGASPDHQSNIWDLLKPRGPSVSKQ